MIDPSDCPFAKIVIHYSNGATEEMRPERGQHFVVMSWTEEDEAITETPGHLLMHCGADILAKMIDRVFNKHPIVYENIRELWQYQHVVAEAQQRLMRRRAAAFSRRVKGGEPKDGKWN